MSEPLSKTVVWIVALILGTYLPLLIRAAILGWLFVFGHIFWGF